MLKLFPRPRDSGLGPVGGLAVAAKFHFAVLQRGPEAGLDEDVQNLAALRLGIVRKQACGGSGAQGSDSLEHQARCGGVDGDGLGVSCRDEQRK